MSKYLSCAETAKLIRLALKESFAGIKFSVTSKNYSGGASIRIVWLDGPTAKMVKAITDNFEGAYFDGMIDYKGSKYHKLDGEAVHLGADFIFEERKMSKARAEMICAKIAEEYGRSDWAEVKGCEYFGYYVDAAFDAPRYSVIDLLEKIDSETCGIVAAESATLARLQFAGDDGYGAGTQGPNNDGNGNQCYKAISAAQDRAALLREIQ